MPDDVKVLIYERNGTELQFPEEINLDETSISGIENGCFLPKFAIGRLIGLVFDRKGAIVICRQCL